MLNTLSVLGTTGLLILLYFWRIMKSGKGLLKEAKFFLVTCLALFFVFYYQGIRDLMERGFIPAQAPLQSESMPPETPALNDYELASKQMLIAPPDAGTPVPGAPEVSIVYPADGAILPYDTNEITVKAQVKDDTDPFPSVIGAGKAPLEVGLNPITVVAVDKDGKTGSAFVVVRRLAQ